MDQRTEGRIGQRPREVTVVRSAVCVAAHLGDEAFYAAGAIDELVQAGARVSVVVLAPRLAPLPVLGPLALAGTDRSALAARSAEVLGLSRVEVLDMSEPPLSIPERIALQARLCAILREERPDLLLSHGPGLTTKAVDRRAAATLANAAIAAAAFGLAPPLPRSGHYWELPERWFFAPAYLTLATPARLAHVFGEDSAWKLSWVLCDTRELVPRKWEALRAYIHHAAEAPPTAFRPYLEQERYIRAARRGSGLRAVASKAAGWS